MTHSTPAGAPGCEPAVPGSVHKVALFHLLRGYCMCSVYSDLKSQIFCIFPRVSCPKLVTIISLNWSHDKKIHKYLKICSLKSHSSTLCVYMARNAWPKSFLTLIGSMLKTWICLITRTYDGLRLWDKYLSCQVGHSGPTRGSPVHWKGPIWSCLLVRHLFWSLSLSPAKTGRGSGERSRWWRWMYHLEQWQTQGFVAGVSQHRGTLEATWHFVHQKVTLQGTSLQFEYYKANLEGKLLHFINLKAPWKITFNKWKDSSEGKLSYFVHQEGNLKGPLELFIHWKAI